MTISSSFFLTQPPGGAHIPWRPWCRGWSRADDDHQAVIRTVQDAVQRSAGFGGVAQPFRCSRIRGSDARGQFFHFADAKIVGARHFFLQVKYSAGNLTKKTASLAVLGNSVLSFYERLPLFCRRGLE
jgi:hypothetical protein